jgi:hypothetical protein
MSYKILPPTLDKQTPAQRVAFAKISEKFDPDFWRQIEKVAAGNHETKIAMRAELLRLRLEK